VLAVPSAAGKLPLAQLTMGSVGVSVSLADSSSGQGFQVFTKDGVQLLGRPLTEEEGYQYLDPALGFNEGVKYSADYLMPDAEKAFKDQVAIYGSFAQTPLVEQFDPSGISLGNAYLPAVVNGANIRAGLTGTVIPDGALHLNGGALPPLVVPEGDELQAVDVASWLSAAQVPDLVVTTVNTQKYASDQIDLTLDLVLQGDGAAAPVTITGGHATLKDLVDAVNTVSEDSRVSAYLSLDGEFVLTNTAGFEGNNFYVGPADVSGASVNATGEAAGMRYGSISIATTLNPDTKGHVGLEIGSAGTADMLKAIGLPVSVSFPGEVPEDLIVFVEGAGTAEVTGTYQAAIEDATEFLRQQPVEVRVTGIGEYQLFDINTGTVVATRTFDPHQYPVSIRYHELTMSLSGVPTIGDRFKLDGNQDGAGDNTKFLELAALETAKVMPGAKTFTDAYIESVSSVGNIAEQAKIAQSALEVIYQQAFDAREQTSGVSLDEEAADLIRFQQAYQASAKVLQTASNLFDAILSTG
jgi:flagellin-like hook-associated protein FlgL